jgi:hypothetical protein
MTTLDGEFWKRVEIARSSRDSNCISVARCLLGVEPCPEPAIDGTTLKVLLGVLKSFNHLKRVLLLPGFFN